MILLPVATSYLVDEYECCAAPEVLGPAVDLDETRLALNFAPQDEHTDAALAAGFPEENRVNTI